MKTSVRYHPTPVRMAINVSKFVEKFESLYTGGVKATLETNLEAPQKLKIVLPPSHLLFNL